MDLLDLGIEQTRSGPPDGFGLSGLLKPLTEVGKAVETVLKSMMTDGTYTKILSKWNLTNGAVTLP